MPVHHDFLVPHAACLVRELLGACDLFEGNSWVVRILEPIKAPVATCLQLLREAVTLRARRNATVLLTPSLRRCTPLGCACVVYADTASRHGKVKVVRSEVTASVGSLDNHLLAADGTRCECQSRHFLVECRTGTVRDPYS